MARGAVILAAVSCLIVVSFPPAAALHTGGTTSTEVLVGTIWDLELDSPRNRLYLSDAPQFGENPDGLVVVDLEGHQETSRIAIGAVRGLALSPSGEQLAVGTSEGILHLVDPNSLEILKTTFLNEDPSTAAVLWDMAFEGEDRLIISLGSQQISCDGGILIVDVPTFSEESRLPGGGCEIETYAGVRVDASRHLLYILQEGRVFIYDLTGSGPVQLADRTDPNFRARGELTPDGNLLYFSSGHVYNAPSLSYLADTGVQGDVFLDTRGGYAYYYAGGPFVDRVRLSDHAFDTRFGFGRGGASQLRTMGAVKIDTNRGIAYVAAPIADNAEELHQLPTSPAILNPYPPDGGNFGVHEGVQGARAVLSGIEPSSVQMEVQGEVVSHFYLPEASVVSYPRAEPWPRGTYDVRVSGRDANGGSHELSWTFSIGSPSPTPWNPATVALGVLTVGAVVAATTTLLLRRHREPRSPDLP